MTLPVIDSSLGLQLAGGQTALAKDLLHSFVATLPQACRQITVLLQKWDMDSLAQQVHKLRGAACYCGIPRITHTLKALEDSLKKKQITTICALVGKFEKETHELLAEFAKTGSK